MNSAEKTNVVTLDNEEIDKFKMIIIGLGLKACRSSYRDSEAESAYKNFINRDLSYLAKYWDYVGDDIQNDIIKKHKDIIFSLIKSISK